MRGCVAGGRGIHCRPPLSKIDCSQGVLYGYWHGELVGAVKVMGIVPFSTETMLHSKSGILMVANLLPAVLLGATKACNLHFHTAIVTKIWILALSAIVSAQAVAAPLCAATLLVTSYRVSFCCLYFSLLLGETWLGTAAATVQEVSPPNMRARASAVYLTVNTLVGGFGPLYVGLLVNSKHEVGVCSLPFTLICRPCTSAPICTFLQALAALLPNTRTPDYHSPFLPFPHLTTMRACSGMSSSLQIVNVRTVLMAGPRRKCSGSHVTTYTGLLRSCRRPSVWRWLGTAGEFEAIVAMVV